MVEYCHTLSVYIHIPFCRKKCPYCHFYSVIPSLGKEEAFFEALCKEIALRAPLFHDRHIVSLYFGGGTPFLLGPKRLSFLLDQFLLPRECEITLEANPESTTLPLLREYKEIGINRLSFGVQSFNDHELEMLGRLHTHGEAIVAIDAARSAGFSNISIDLMYDLPSQTLPLWEHSLLSACSLPIQHLSLYNLMIEPHSAWYRKKERVENLQPTDGLSLKMYEMAVEKTALYGFSQYEISAFARSKAISQHNIGYWKGREFLGFGPSAFSFFDNRRFSNVAHLTKYCGALNNGELPIDFTDNTQSRLREMVAVGLRMNDGVDLAHLETVWGSVDPELDKALDKLVSWKLITYDKGLIRLTDRGRVLYDGVASELI